MEFATEIFAIGIVALGLITFEVVRRTRKKPPEVTLPDLDRDDWYKRCRAEREILQAKANRPAQQPALYPKQEPPPPPPRVQLEDGPLRPIVRELPAEAFVGGGGNFGGAGASSSWDDSPSSSYDSCSSADTSSSYDSGCTFDSSSSNCDTSSSSCSSD